MLQSHITTIPGERRRDSDFGPAELLFRFDPADPKCRTFLTSNASRAVVLSLGGKRGPPGPVDFNEKGLGRTRPDVGAPGLVDAILKSDLWQEADGGGEPWRGLIIKIITSLGERMLYDNHTGSG